MNYSARGKKKAPPGWGERGFSLGLLSTMAWVATLFVAEIKTPPWKPPPISGTSKNGWQGQLLVYWETSWCLGYHFCDHDFMWPGVEEEVREGQENRLLCVREEA